MAGYLTCEQTRVFRSREAVLRSRSATDEGGESLAGLCFRRGMMPVMANDLGLQVIGRVGEAIENKEDQKPAAYLVKGLPGDDHCLICYAGQNEERRSQWSILWYRNAHKVASPESTFDSPEDALLAVQEILSDDDQAFLDVVELKTGVR